MREHVTKESRGKPLCGTLKMNEKRGIFLTLSSNKNAASHADPSTPAESFEIKRPEGFERNGAGRASRPFISMRLGMQSLKKREESKDISVPQNIAKA